MMLRLLLQATRQDYVPVPLLAIRSCHDERGFKYVR